MDSKLHISVSPHICGKQTTQGIMLDVVLSLLPATVCGVIVFGWKALAVVVTCIAAAVLGEGLFNLITKREQTIRDLSAVVTGLLLALNLPANIPLWQAVIGSLFAIVIVKCFFGGLGCNVVNPAITGRVFMLVAFGSMATAAFPLDSVATATPLVELADGKIPDLLPLFLGNVGGAIGETGALALLIGFIYLLVRRVITWHVPVVYVGSVFLFTLLLEGRYEMLADGQILAALWETFASALAYVLAGGLLLGAIFMATDYVTSPSTPAGKLIFGLGAGIITVVIRYWGNYPEGVSFAILLMNILNPFIERWTERKIFGGQKA